MKCPRCRNRAPVIDTERVPFLEGQVNRVRQCVGCGNVFHTFAEEKIVDGAKPFIRTSARYREAEEARR
jgi:transcriptional regulator NrdR family protein